MSGEPEYVVEAIVDAQIGASSREYLVKWMDYPSSDNTWVPKKALLEHRGGKAALKVYKAQLTDAEVAPRRKRRASTAPVATPEPKKAKKESAKSKKTAKPTKKATKKTTAAAYTKLEEEEPIEQSVVVDRSEPYRIYADRISEETQDREYYIECLDGAHYWRLADELPAGLLNAYESHREEMPVLGSEMPSKVRTVKYEGNELLVQIIWHEGTDDEARSWVRNIEARQFCPGLLLDFYESRLRFTPRNNNRRGN